MDPRAKGTGSALGLPKPAFGAGSMLSSADSEEQTVLRQDLRSKSQQPGASPPQAYGTWLVSMPLS